MNTNTSFELETDVDAELGNIVIIQRDGIDGANFPLLKGVSKWSIGCNSQSDICLKRPGIMDIHCIINLDQSDVRKYIFSVASFGPVYINGSAIPINTPVKNSKKLLRSKILKHRDVLAILGRQFRIEYIAGHPMTVRKRCSSIGIATKRLKDNAKESSIFKNKSGTSRDSPAIKRITGAPFKRQVYRDSENRRVTFGRTLSPEIFDYRRPPSTPIQKGATPLSGIFGCKSIIKTPFKPLPESVTTLNWSSSFQLSPSPEAATPTVNIEEVPDSRNSTPKLDKRKSRRSSLFRPKKCDLRVEEAAEKLNSVLQEITHPALPETRKLPTPKEVTVNNYCHIGDMTKHYRRWNGSITPKQRLQSRIKRLSANPFELEQVIQKYGQLGKGLMNRISQYKKEVEQKRDNKNQEMEKENIAPTSCSLPLPMFTPESASNSPEKSTLDIPLNLDSNDKYNSPAAKFEQFFAAKTHEVPHVTQSGTVKDLDKSCLLDMEKSKYKSEAVGNLDLPCASNAPNAQVFEELDPEKTNKLVADSCATEVDTSHIEDSADKLKISACAPMENTDPPPTICFTNDEDLECTNPVTNIEREKLQDDSIGTVKEVVPKEVDIAETKISSEIASSGADKFATRTFEYYCTPIKTRNPFEEVVKINWASTLIIDENNESAVISRITFDDENDLIGMDILFADALHHNYVLASLFAESREKGDTIDDMGDIMMEILFGGEPLSINLDDEISISTSSLNIHYESQQTEAAQVNLIDDTSGRRPLTARRTTRSMLKSVETLSEKATAKTKTASKPLRRIKSCKSLIKETVDEFLSREVKIENDEERATIKEEIVEENDTGTQPTEPSKRTSTLRQRKESKMSQKQKTLKNRVKNETRQRIIDGADPGRVPDIIMAQVSLKSSIRSQSSLKKLDQVQFSFDEETHISSADNSKEALIEEIPKRPRGRPFKKANSTNDENASNQNVSKRRITRQRLSQDSPEKKVKIDVSEVLPVRLSRPKKKAVVTASVNAESGDKKQIGLPPARFTRSRSKL